MAGDSKRATLKDVAGKAGVSVGMASRVLGEYGSYSEVTKNKVVEAARTLNYRPNVVARSLRVGQTRAIGVLVSNIASFHWTTFVRGVEEAASRHGYQVILGNTDDDPDKERIYLTALYERNVDGIILSPSPASIPDDLRNLAAEGFPMVLIDSGLRRTGRPTHQHRRSRGGACKATEYLIESRTPADRARGRFAGVQLGRGAAEGATSTPSEAHGIEDRTRR